jgi:C-terminus of AA_permease
VCLCCDLVVMLPIVLLLCSHHMLLLSTRLPASSLSSVLFTACLVPLGLMYTLKQELRGNSFRTPFVPLFPAIGVFINTYLLYKLDTQALYRLIVWTFIGLCIYAFYGVHHSVMSDKYSSVPPTRYTYNADDDEIDEHMRISSPSVRKRTYRSLDNEVEQPDLDQDYANDSEDIGADELGDEESQTQSHYQPHVNDFVSGSDSDH